VTAVATPVVPTDPPVEAPAPRATVVMVVRDEPLARLARALAAVAAQEDVAGLTVCIAAPRDDHAGLAALRTGGAVDAIRLVDNPGGARSAGLNRAIAAAPDPVVVRVDARSEIPTHYVAACLRRLDDPDVGMAGGVQRPVAAEGADRAARGIARALRNQWLLGNAAYRRTDAGGPADTVYLGAFRRDEVLALGGYDEALDANEDYDLAQRFLDLGRTVWLEEGQCVRYEPRADWRGLARQYHAFGAAKVRFWRRTGRRANGRQRVALGACALGGLVAVASVRRPRRLIGLTAVGLTGLVVLDHVADPSERDPRVRARACVASTVIVGSWVSGVVSGYVGRRVR